MKTFSTVLVVVDEDGEATVYGPYKYRHEAQSDLDKLLAKDPEACAWVVELTDPPGID